MASSASSSQVAGRVVFRTRKTPPTVVFDDFATLENSYFDNDLAYAVPPERNNPVPTSMSSNKLMPKTRASIQKASTDSIPTPPDNRSKQVLPSFLASPSEQGQPSFLDGIPPRGDLPNSTLASKVAGGL
jgi:hypothetical protein